MTPQTVLAVLFFCSTASASVLREEPLKVSLFYESLCPSCIQFIEDQLIDVYKLFKDHIQLELLPYGNAHQRFVDGHWVVNCQHGRKECLGNKLHACAIYQKCGDSGTVSCASDKVSKVLAFISCVMKHKNRPGATFECSITSKLTPVDMVRIVECAATDKGDQLLNLYGNHTQEFVHWMKGTPAVAINGKVDNAAVNNLMARLCELKPSVCRHRHTYERDDEFEVFLA